MQGSKRQRKNIYVLAVILIAAMAVSGCAQMRDKFIRKPKEKKETKRYRGVTDYNVRPNLDLYIKRYIFWKNWHKELLTVLGHENRKKAIVASREEVSNLISMRNMLVDEKADELQVVIDKMTEIEMGLRKRKTSAGKEVRLRKQLEAVGRKVRRNFSYKKAKGFIRSDWKKREAGD